MQPRLARRATATLVATAALASAAAVLAPPVGGSGLRELFESLMVLRDGHGARHLPQHEATAWRNR